MEGKDFEPGLGNPEVGYVEPTSISREVSVEPVAPPEVISQTPNSAVPESPVTVEQVQPVEPETNAKSASADLMTDEDPVILQSSMDEAMINNARND